MADNRIEIELELTSNADAQLRKITVAVNDFAKNTEDGMKKAGGAFDVFAGVVSGEAVIGAFKELASAAAEFFKVLITDGIKAAQEQEDAINRLNQALVASGEYSKETSADMVEFAGALQKTTKFADETILGASALIQSLGQLDKEGLKGATKAAIDLSAALGIDLNHAALLVGKAATGEVGSFTRYGLAIEKGTTDAQTFANTLAAINSKFGGAASSQIKTFSGSIAQLANSFNDVQEEIGNAFIKNQSLVNVLHVVGQVIQEVQAYLVANKVALSEMVSQGLVYAIDGLVVFARALDVILIPIKVAIAQVQNIGEAMGAAAAAAVAAAQGNFKGAFDIISEQAKTSGDRLKNALIGNLTGDSGLSKVENLLTRLGAAAKDGLGKTTDETIRLTNSVKNAKDATVELTDAQKKLAEEGKRIFEEAIRRDPAVEFQKKKEALLFYFSQEVIGQEQQNTALKALDDDLANKRSEAIRKQADNLLEINQATLDSDKFTQQERVRTHIAALQKIVLNEQLTAKDRAKIQKDLVTLQNTQENQRYQAASDTLGALATLQTSKSKELAAIGKAAAIAQATIDTYRGASAAAASLAGIPVFGPALAIGAAAAFITAGLARVAQIVGTPLAEGITSVPAGFGNDTFPARLSTGERVVDAGTNQDLKAFLSGSNAMIPLLQAIATSVKNQKAQITVVVGTKTIFDSVVEGLQDGRVLSV